MTLSGLHYETAMYLLLCLLFLIAALALYLYPKLMFKPNGKSNGHGSMDGLEIAEGVSLHFPPNDAGKGVTYPRKKVQLPEPRALSAQAIGQTILVTTDNWFYAPDGKTYRAVFGTLRGVLSDGQVLGIKTNARSTNWYLEVGNMVIAGCQIHYAMLAERSEMNFGKVTQDFREGLQVQAVTHEANIYDANRDDADMFKSGISRIDPETEQ